MTTLLLIRHGQSDANKEKIFAGHFDADLGSIGMKQAELTARYIADNFSIDKIYSSDLKRAFKTGKALADITGKEIIATDKLREINAGKWEGLPYDTLKKDFAKDYGIWLDDIGNSRCTEGESVKELCVRIMGALTEIAEENYGKTIAIATHATPIRIMQTMVQTGNISDMKSNSWVPNASVSVFEYVHGKWSAKKLSIAEHLGDFNTYLAKNV